MRYRRRSNIDPGHVGDVKAAVTEAFKELRRNGYFARQNFWCCQSCAWADIGEKKADKAVFYHQQDNARFRETGETMLAWSGDGAFIAETLRRHGLLIEWDGTADQRILVKGFDEDRMRREKADHGTYANRVWC